MEDLLQPVGTKQRTMVMSYSDDEVPKGSTCVSKSCPDIFAQRYASSLSHGSLPDHLNPSKIFGIDFVQTTTTAPNNVHKNVIIDDKSCPFTPPPSPSYKNRPEKNLVIISTLIVDSNAHNFKSYYNSVSIEEY